MIATALALGVTVATLAVVTVAAVLRTMQVNSDSSGRSLEGEP